MPKKMKREHYVEMLKRSAQYIADNAEKFMPDIEGKTDIKISILFVPDALPAIITEQRIMNMDIAMSVAHLFGKDDETE